MVRSNRFHFLIHKMLCHRQIDAKQPGRCGNAIGRLRKREEERGGERKREEERGGGRRRRRERNQPVFIL